MAKIKIYDFIDTEIGDKFSGTNGKQIEKEINEFALKHKIINVSYAVNPSSSGYYSTQAMVLYKTSFWRKIMANNQ